MRPAGLRVGLGSSPVLELQAGPARVMIDPAAGGRVASVCVAGLEVIVRRPAGEADPLRWGMYPMAPWAGRVRHGRFAFGGVEHRLALNLPPHAIHGTAFRSTWSVAEAGEESCRLTCPVGGDEWPFAGLVTQTIAVDPGGLHLALTLDADTPMPASLGWHPWFQRDLPGGGALEVSLEATERWERGDDGLPTGRLVKPGPRPDLGWDDCFTHLVGPPVLTWPGALELTLTSSCEHWVLFDATPHAVCVEPQTGPPDALNLAPTVVEPGEPLTATFDWAWRLG